MGAKFFISCASIALLGGCMRGPSPEEYNNQSKAEIQQLFERWAKAFEAKDLDGVMTIYAPGNALTAYDIVPPLEFKGAEAYRKDYADFFAQFAGPIHVEDRDRHIEVQGDLAFVYGLERMTGKLSNGTPVDIWLRYTEGLRLIGKDWRVVHEHISVPVDLNTGKARTDLTP
jgi:ketosteroid isomerase-like protein